MRIIRYEFKYFINEEIYLRVMECISSYLVPDPYAKKYEGYRYYVNSLYLDSPSRAYYEEKMAGKKIRRKIRMRCYSKNFFDADYFFAEIKKRDQSHIDKLRVKMASSDFREFMDNNFLRPPDKFLSQDFEDRTIMEEMIYHCNCDILFPAAFILYEREAYLAENDDTVRITFDRSVMSQKFYSTFADPSIGWSSVFPGKIILEIKVRTLLPFWLHNMVKKLSLDYESISKYCFSIDRLAYELN